MTLLPKQEILDDLKNALRTGLPYYIEYAYEFGDSADELAKILHGHSQIIGWAVCPYESKNNIFKYIHSASVLAAGNADRQPGLVHIILHPESIEDEEFDVDEFEKYIIHTISHEAVHMSQRDKMGHEFYASDDRVTGFQKMNRYYNTCGKKLTKEEEFEGFRLYLSDVQEIMAHARDLAAEMNYADEPLTVLRDPEGFIDFLPTWYKYRVIGFKRSDPVIKRLLKYTYGYMHVNNAHKDFFTSTKN